MTGAPQQAIFTCAAMNGYGQLDALLSYYHSVSARWSSARQFLPQLTAASCSS